MKVYVSQGLPPQIFDAAAPRPPDPTSSNVDFDPTAPERAISAMTELRMWNLDPLTIVCGKRAMLSLMGYMIDFVERNNGGRLGDARAIVFLGYGGHEDPIMFQGCPVQLDMLADEDSIRCTTNSHGIDQMVRARR